MPACTQSEKQTMAWYRAVLSVWVGHFCDPATGAALPISSLGKTRIPSRVSPERASLLHQSQKITKRTFMGQGWPARSQSIQGLAEVGICTGHW